MSEGRTAAETLLQDVKDYLGVTWSDDATDRKLLGIIEGGVVYIDLKIGAVCDYTAAGLPRTLLLDYCRYVRDDALDIFECNYLSLLLAARHERMVRDAQTADETG